MSDEPDQSGRARFLSALDVRRHAVRGFVVGFLVTAAAYTFFIIIPDGVELATSLYYLGLAISMALALGALVTTVLVALQARRLAREL